MPLAWVLSQPSQQLNWVRFCWCYRWLRHVAHLRFFRLRADAAGVLCAAWAARGFARHSCPTTGSPTLPYVRKNMSWVGESPAPPQWWEVCFVPVLGPDLSVIPCPSLGADFAFTLPPRAVDVCMSPGTGRGQKSFLLFPQQFKDFALYEIRVHGKFVTVPLRRALFILNFLWEYG